MKRLNGTITHFALALLTAGTLGSALHGTEATVAHADGDTTVACTSTTWPTLPNLNFDRVTPGSIGGANESFITQAGGALSATVTDGADVFQVTGMESFTVKRVRMPIDLSEMPRGYHGPRFYYETDCTPDTQVNGATPLTVTAGEMVQVYVKGTPDQSRTDYSGTLSISQDSSSVQVPMSMFVGGITASMDTASLVIPQGRSGDIPVTVTSLGGGDTTATFDLYDSVDGIMVTNPTVEVPAGQTVHTSLHVVVARNVPLGDQNYNLTVSALGGRQAIGLGSLTLTVILDLGWLNYTVTPLPVQSVPIPLSAAADAWNAARSAACDRIKDLTGREVDAYLGRTIRNPDCYLAPLQMSAKLSGNELTITGSAPGNWVSFYVTTPDGFPAWADPAFTANYDVSMSMIVDLPRSLDGSSTLRVKSISIAVHNAYLDSHNLTADIIEAVAKAFGGSQYFHPADYALGNVGDKLTGTINSALSQFDGVLQSAPASGFTQPTFSLDPNSLVLTVTIS